MVGWITSLFLPRWVRYMHRIERMYEREAFLMTARKDSDLANPTIIAGRILARELRRATSCCPDSGRPPAFLRWDSVNHNRLIKP
jgi:hypothetical protein